MPIQVLARFPGVDVARRFQISIGWGIRPETHTIETTRNHYPSQRIGDLSLSVTGVIAPGLVLRDCRYMSSGPQIDGRCMHVFEDRRWKWALAPGIDGDYNEIDPITLSTFRRQKSARELAQLLLAQMGETSYNVQSLPANTYPRKIWAGHAPAQELEILAMEHGLVVAWDPITDSVRLATPGFGEATPTGDAMVRVPGIAGPALPQRIIVQTATSLWQSKFRIGIPYAKELDGTLVPLDSVSYKPSVGWNKCSPFYFSQVTGSTVVNGEKIEHKDLAASSVWKFYGIAAPTGGWAPTPLVGSPYAPTSAENMGPFLDTRLERDARTDARLPIVIRGEHFVDTQATRNKSINGEFVGSARFVDNRPIFEVDRPLFKYSPDTWEPIPATGSITVGHAIKTAGEIQIRFERSKNYAGDGPELRDYHEELTLEYMSAESRRGGLGLAVPWTNQTRIEAACDAFIDAQAAVLKPLQSETVQFRGLDLRAQIDGAIRRLVFSGGVDVAPSTTVGRNNEPNPYTIPWENRPAQVARKLAEATERRERWKETIEKRRNGFK